MHTTGSANAEPVAPNQLARRFGVGAHPVPNAAWCGDLTEVPTHEGWLFLAVLLRLATRRVVRWAVGDTLAAALPLAAVRRALATRRPPPGLVHHTRRGCQHASRDVPRGPDRVRRRAEHEPPGDCWDNAIAESFFATLEHELLADPDFRTRHEAAVAVGEYVGWYNGAAALDPGLREPDAVPAAARRGA